jgi:hypothetical protein
MDNDRIWVEGASIENPTVSAMLTINTELYSKLKLAAPNSGYPENLSRPVEISATADTGVQCPSCP